MKLKRQIPFLTEKGVPPVNNITDLATTLRNIKNFGRLPDRYITVDEAKRLGWSGQASETLWGVKKTNNRWMSVIFTTTQRYRQIKPG